MHAVFLIKWAQSSAIYCSRTHLLAGSIVFLCGVRCSLLFASFGFFAFLTLGICFLLLSLFWCICLLVSVCRRFRLGLGLGLRSGLGLVEDRSAFVGGSASALFDLGHRENQSSFALGLLLCHFVVEPLARGGPHLADLFAILCCEVSVRLVLVVDLFELRLLSLAESLDGLGALIEFALPSVHGAADGVQLLKALHEERFLAVETFLSVNPVLEFIQQLGHVLNGLRRHELRVRLVAELVAVRVDRGFEVVALVVSLAQDALSLGQALLQLAGGCELVAAQRDDAGGADLQRHGGVLLLFRSWSGRRSSRCIALGRTVAFALLLGVLFTAFFGIAFGSGLGVVALLLRVALFFWLLRVALVLLLGRVFLRVGGTVLGFRNRLLLLLLHVLGAADAERAVLVVCHDHSDLGRFFALGRERGVVADRERADDGVRALRKVLGGAVRHIDVELATAVEGDFLEGRVRVALLQQLNLVGAVPRNADRVENGVLQ
mmetsp:Transcript_32661/g.47933  ORF Transcript_32661/g.47933 Transcript_32661/m.47933 type:complete len:491 (+) Transcript_32661:164-1636(+)